MRDKTFEEFQRRLHCAQIDTDKIEEHLLEALNQIEEWQAVASMTRHGDRDGNTPQKLREWITAVSGYTDIATKRIKELTEENRMLRGEGRDEPKKSAFPENAELCKAAKILAQPKAEVVPLPPSPSLERSLQWVEDNRERYNGKWVAVSNGELKAQGTTYQEVVRQLNSLNGILLTKVF
ncbi:hypothetical protein GF348_10010 [candidate division KSB3 bacterium]|nr:hypothetical protein [candidate division KSB3 bacterium]